MPRVGLDMEIVVKRAAQLSNEIGIENITLKILADDLKVQPPSLYNHVKGIDALKTEIMIYGWKEMKEKIGEAAVGVSGYDALDAICRAFYEYATQNVGVFNAMLWYNKFENDQMHTATTKLFEIVFKICASLNISQENCNHLIRTFRGFLEGFSLLVNNKAFGNPISIQDSFDISVKVLLAGIKTFEGK